VCARIPVNPSVSTCPIYFQKFNVKKKEKEKNNNLISIGQTKTKQK
jgi:hypothetical protein